MQSQKIKENMAVAGQAGLEDFHEARKVNYQSSANSLIILFPAFEVGYVPAPTPNSYKQRTFVKVCL